MKRLVMLALRQPEHHHGHHESIVGTEQPLEDDEESDRDEIGELNVHGSSVVYAVRGSEGRAYM